MRTTTIKHIFSRYWLAIWLTGVAAVIAASLLPHFTPPSKGVIPLDKICHFGVYAILAMIPLARIRRRELAFIATASIPVLGMLLEYAQKNVAGRDFSAEDMIANNLGALVGIALGLILRLNRRAERLERSSL